ncbi:MAG: crotonobetainyl-CoA:carnitine CoA-transferase CaiB-like acyl-CoA transferase [Candidatus Azotimanducaceae bacterium]|jgi:crotonobetainyl-CoA:carnitine CoA-transferase CaiB-like acyl-CoA transferase
MLDTAAAFRLMACALSIVETEHLLNKNSAPFTKLRQSDEIPKFIHKKVFRTIEHRITDELRETCPTPRLSETPEEGGGPAPTIGQHTAEIPRIIGLEEQLPELIRQGIVGI